MNGELRISGEEKVDGGVILHIQVGSASLQLKFTNHAQERARRWSLSRERVLETLVYPEEVLRGHRGRFITHRRYGEHLVRAVYEYEAGLPSLVTVYFPYAKRYYRGGGSYEDKILP
ncbi:MAG TPA: DUF4258 domain-containing protein [Dehalococcoidia bacterium]|nr:DUF4258 domain-containing protein [Dehalococcoidia bacterium]